MLSCIPFPFFSDEQEPPPPAHPTVYVLRNGQYEAQYLMPVMPRPDMLDFEGFVPARWGRSGAGARRATAPEMQQAPLRKSQLCMRRDSVQLCVTPAAPEAAVVPPAVESTAASPETRLDDRVASPAASQPAGSLQVNFTFDAVRRGTISIHLRVAEQEQCLESQPDDGTQHENSTDRPVTNGSVDEKEDLHPSHDVAEGKRIDDGFASDHTPTRRDIVLVPLKEGVSSEVHRSSFEPGAGQHFESPQLRLENISLDALVYDAERPTDIPVAIRLEAEPEAEEAPTILFVYLALQAASGPSGSPWPSQIVRQRLQQDNHCFILRDVFGTSNLASFDPVSTEDAAKEGRSECVICLTEPRDTAVLPCRHMCFCSHCAGIVRLQCERCPICRQRVGSLMQLKRE